MSLIFLYINELKILICLNSLSLIYNFIILYYFIDFIIITICEVLLINTNISDHFIFTNIIELLNVKIIFSCIISLFLNYYTIIIQFWLFFSKGFYKYENIYIIIFIIFVFLSLLIIYIYYYYFLQNIFLFFNLQKINNIELFKIYFEPNLKEYIYFFIKFIISIYLYLQFIFLFIFLFYDYAIRRVLYFNLIILLLFFQLNIFDQFILSIFFLLFIEFFFLINIIFKEIKKYYFLK
jgi:hypothetical protein